MILTLNHKAAFYNIRIFCPSLAQFLINTYRAPVRLFITASGEIASTDPLAMPMYALAISSLIHLLQDSCPDIS